MLLKLYFKWDMRKIFFKCSRLPRKNKQKGVKNELE